MKTCKTCLCDFSLDEFHNSRGWKDGKVPHCKTCEKSRKKEDYLKDRDNRLEKAKTNYWNNRAGARANGIKRRYGITWDDYLDLYNKHAGCCHICAVPLELFGSDKHKVAQVDHCHKTGKVRGLLCTACNTGLGNFKDDVNLLSKVIGYLTNDKT